MSINTYDMWDYGRFFYPFGIVIIIIGLGCFLSLGITQIISYESVAISAIVGCILCSIFMISHMSNPSSISIQITFSVVSVLVIFGIILGIWSIKKKPRSRQYILSAAYAIGIVCAILLIFYMMHIWKWFNKKGPFDKWSQ